MEFDFLTLALMATQYLLANAIRVNITTLMKKYAKYVLRNALYAQKTRQHAFNAVRGTTYKKIDA